MVLIGDAVMVFNLGVFIGILLIVLSIPLLFDTVKPNQWYGFRTSKTLSDPEIWYKANCFAAKNMIIAGAVIIAEFVILPFFKHRNVMLSIVLFYFMVSIPVLVAIVRSLLYLRKL
jgi:uncharacterized membrane protein